MNEVKKRLNGGDPIMMNSAGWLQHYCDNYKFLSESDVIEYQRKSALAGYPIALSNYGERLIRGNLGVAKDRALGLSMMNQAVAGGYGRAAYDLASFYIKGEYLPKNPKKARQYYITAKSEGVAPDRLAKLSSEIAIAEALSSPSGTLSSGKNTAESTPITEQFAALAVSLAGGAYGFAHDYPDAKSAQERAIKECKSRGGNDCDVKMIGQGKGCMAYHSTGGSATAHGWAIGATRNAVQKRASQECRKRNRNAQCDNTSWVCNDRTKSKLKVVLNKPLPAVTTGETAKSQCLVLTYLSCKAFVPGKSRSTDITGASRQMYSIENCGGRSRQALGWWLEKNNWLHAGREKNGTWGGFSNKEKAYFKPILMDFMNKAISAFPACTKPETVIIRFFKLPESYDIYAKPHYWRKVIAHTIP
ncbi:MAG: DUF4189 domain-containing protein [Roseibium sp.]|uniref:DUF4189 domain-containing protein n=1 Tax=Roseibium sp. TaxID=1936156 RepID=UPI001B03A566|nr:DUF4189 domain-containing protein [Roseibium sp.]MBO6895184.1 DUF4189 domain-containing protein [Roseibium sp.]